MVDLICVCNREAGKLRGKGRRENIIYIWWIKLTLRRHILGGGGVTGSIVDKAKAKKDKIRTEVVPRSCG